MAIPPFGWKDGPTGGTPLTALELEAQHSAAGQYTDAMTQWVVADVTVPDGTTDNTTYLAGLLTTALAAGVTLRIPAGKNGNWVVNKLTLPSNTSVDATGATFAQANGVNTRLILNTSLTLGTPGSARDTNIRWRGGTFVKGTGQQNVGKLSTNPTALDDHCTMFGFVDGLTVTNIAIAQSGTGGDAGTGGRYGCFVYACTNFFFDGFSATCVSLSVNQSSIQLQYCQNGHIRNVTGSFGDDAVALVNGNQVGDTLANGVAAMENITVEDVFATSPSTGVRIMGGSTGGVAPFFNTQKVRVNNVRGNFASRGGTGAIYFGGSGGTYPNLQNGFCTDIDVSNVQQTRANTPAVYVDSNAECHGITLRQINNLQDSSAVQIVTAAGHCSIKVADCEFTSAITTGSYFPFSVSGNTCRMLQLENVRLNAATSGTATVAPVNATTGPGLLCASNVRVTGKAYALGVFAAASRIMARNVEQEDANGRGWFQTTTGAVVTVCDWSEMPLAGSNTFTQTAGTVAVAGASATSLPGASGTATLAAGTIVVNTGSGMATATSLIRLTNIAANGTLGNLSVARGTGTFTINSSNAADTSVVFWEIVSS